MKCVAPRDLTKLSFCADVVVMIGEYSASLSIWKAIYAE